MRSFYGRAGNAKLRGKKSMLLQCGCCVARDFRLKELIKNQQKEIDIFNKKGNDMEKQEKTLAVYKMSDLLTDLPKMYCNEFFDILFDGDKYFAYGDAEKNISIPVESIFNEGLGYIPKGLDSTLALTAVVKIVDEKGGEDQGSYYRTVFKFEYPDNTTEYVDIEGYYSSYDGVDYSNHQPVLVEPKYKTIQVWE